MIRRILLALAALLAAPHALAQTASCDATNRYTLNWNNQTSATLSTSATTNYTVTNGAGGSRTVGVSFGGVTNAYVNNFPDNNNVTRAMPAVGPYSNGGLGGQVKTLTLGTDFAGYTTDIASNTNVAAVTFSFSAPIMNIAFKIFDLDFSTGQYRDWIRIVGRNGTSTYAPTMSSDVANHNNGTGTRTATGSWVNFGATTVSGVAVSSSEALGINGNAALTEGTGNVNVSFAQPVTSIEIRYGNGPAASMTNTAGVQGIGIHNISFCAVPTVSMTKTSTPDAGALGAYDLPGNDQIYTLTVTNSGGSTVDASTIVLTDVMPAGTTFKNVAFDATTTLPVKLVTAGGTSLAAANITYRQVASGSFSYTPASGYDAQVAEIRIQPGGQLAANSSFSVQFKARIN